MFGDETDKYIAAGGHYGNQSSKVAKAWAESLGYEYLSAVNKKEFVTVVDRFLNPRITDKPMVFEVFTTTEEETGALKLMEELIVDTKEAIKHDAKNIARSVVGEKGMSTLKSFFKK